MIESLFKENNLKVTKQRLEIINIINKLKDKATISNIVKNVDMNRSTVYRIIDKLCSNNIVIKDINVNNKDYYVLKNNHKHYIKCIKCNSIKDLDECPFDNMEIDNFKIIKHSLKIDGICNKCQEE